MGVNSIFLVKMVEADNTNYDDQAEEIEALQSIFTEEEFILLNSKPYSFEVMINSNTEEEERNHLKLMIRFDLPKDYPENSIPLYRIKNLCKEYLESNDLYRYEEALRERAHESIGAPMIFDLCDLIKEEITTLNDAVLNKYDIIEEKEAAQAKADAASFSSMMSYLTSLKRKKLHRLKRMLYHRPTPANVPL